MKAQPEDLREFLLSLGDDELILGHRTSEWCGYAPILEEDIAFANLALDEIGHATAWFGLLAELDGQDPETFPDRLVFTRPVEAFRNIQMVELPNGDWAFSMLRQFLFDAVEEVRLAALEDSQLNPLAETAARIRIEERYHLRHTRAWIRRLSLGTPESRQRVQAALDSLWPLAFQALTQLPGEMRLVEAGFLPLSSSLQNVWRRQTADFLQECGLVIPVGDPPALDRRQHTPHLKTLVTEMQSVARSEPEAGW